MVQDIVANKIRFNRFLRMAAFHAAQLEFRRLVGNELPVLADFSGNTLLLEGEGEAVDACIEAAREAGFEIEDVSAMIPSGVYATIADVKRRRRAA